ncbi:hormogonium polysaccharide secretion pseudopilin HpsC [Moorena sp. SIO4G3]|uniref:hormogonium polysaccharide secretion pseudopilin HpsC n=1 Tax=Moorena sp. SIO4G3 TaxID=2607821 RepID=UPI00142B5272|nr:hormogonium polysaccharide secretion pseudopilin HpsC [Moorena sp. SIO4G3]NEO82469.1 prepilin-type N-terminal cleavage/methylation domain-containing protein [Moorena sp. SIO4G3]
MINSLRTFLAHKVKSNKSKINHGGFTLIELLVAMIVAVLIIAPLLRFMITVLDTDRKEQAKTTSEQEIQAAIDYIARDLEQAVYIYDDSGIHNEIPPLAGTNGCNPKNNCKPVLVFWKRKYFDREDQKVDVNGKNRKIGDLTEGNDTFVYALVAYYLIEEKTDWLDIGKIGRFEIHDKVISLAPKEAADIPASKGFKSFNLSEPGNTLKDKLNQWTKGDAAYDTPVQTLVNYIDISPEEDNQNNQQNNCPNDNYLQVPEKSEDGFYVCVDSKNKIAQLVLRGNALARITTNEKQYNFLKKQSSYFPTVTMQVEGRGFLNIK